MNVMKMIKDLMNLKIITESKLMTPELKRQIKVHADKLIDIDSPVDDVSKILTDDQSKKRLRFIDRYKDKE